MLSLSIHDAPNSYCSLLFLLFFAVSWYSQLVITRHQQGVKCFVITGITKLFEKNSMVTLDLNSQFWKKNRGLRGVAWISRAFGGINGIVCKALKDKVALDIFRAGVSLLPGEPETGPSVTGS